MWSTSNGLTKNNSVYPNKSRHLERQRQRKSVQRIKIKSTCTDLFGFHFLCFWCTFSQPQLHTVVLDPVWLRHRICEDLCSAHVGCFKHLQYEIFPSSSENCCFPSDCSAVTSAHNLTGNKQTAVNQPFSMISCPTSQLSSSHLSSTSHLGASVPSIPDYVYSQLSPPSLISPEGKKIQQDICTMSQRGQRHRHMHNSTVLTIKV